MKNITLVIFALAVTMEGFTLGCGAPQCSDYYLGGLDTSVETARSGDGWIHGGGEIAGYWIDRVFEDGSSAAEGELRFGGDIAVALHIGQIISLDSGLSGGGIVWGENSLAGAPECYPTGQKTTSVAPYIGVGIKLSAGFDKFGLALRYRTGLGYCVNSYEYKYQSIPTILGGLGNPEKWTFAVGSQGIAITHHHGWIHGGVFFLPLFSGARYGGPGPPAVCPSHDTPPKYRSDRFNYAVGVKIGFGRY